MDGENESGSEVECPVDVLGVCERIGAVDGRRDPGDEEGDEEEEGYAGVEEGINFLFTQRDCSRDRWNVEYCWPGWSPQWLWFLWLADFNIDRVGIVLVICVGLINLPNREFSLGWLPLFGSDGHFGRQHNSCEGVFVEGVQESVECIPLSPYVAAGHEVDYHRDQDSDPRQFEFLSPKMSGRTHHMKTYRTAMRRKDQFADTQHQRTAPPYILPRSFVLMKI